jgi:predicted secreted protein
MAKYPAKGSTLSINSVLIPQWRDGSSSGGEAERIDVTTMDSAGNRREFLQGFKGEMSYSFTLEYDPALTSHQGLATLFGAGTVVPVIIGLPQVGTGAQIAFSAFISTFGLPNAEVAGSLNIPVTLTITGDLTVTAPS